jgi:hypothetical protein
VLAEPVYDDNGHMVRVDPQPCFAHGQLTVALTRVGHPDRVSIYLDPATYEHCRTPFIIYPEALLQNVTDITATFEEPNQEEVNFDTIFGDGLAEADDWASILWHARARIAEGQRNTALAFVLTYRAPVWGSIEAELWYEFFAGRRPTDAAQYYEQVAAVHIHADDVMELLSSAGTCIWSGAVDDSASFNQWADWGAGGQVAVAIDNEPPPAAQGSSIDYQPEQMDAFCADQMMAQFAANAEQWASDVNMSATDPNVPDMDIRWEHNLLTDTSNVAAYFGDGQPTSLMANPFDGRLPETSDAQRSVWDGIGSELTDMHDVQGNGWDGIGSDAWDWDMTGNSDLANPFGAIADEDDY